jgi:archaellum biogenesis ATPase FlaH
MKLKRIGGVFDGVIEGIPAGSLIYFATDPTISSELVLYQLCGVRKTYYFVTERNPKRVEEGMKEAGVNLEQVEIIDFRDRKRSTSEIISTLKHADDANLIIDTFIPFTDTDSLDLVKEMLEECEERDVLCFLVIPKGACDEIIARRLAYMCDVFFDLCADRIGDKVIVKLGAPKIRGLSPMTEYMRLKIETSTVEFDMSRDIV